jgi:RNA polymerase sigma-70 factor, ECF subfamily
VATDQDLENIRRVLAGDLSAFENIVRRWQGPLVNLAFRLCRNRQIAEELAQEAFLQIYRKLPGYRGDAAFSTWIFSISLNLYRSSLRRRSLREIPMDDVAEPNDTRAPHLDIEVEERKRLVRRAVAALPGRYRDAVVVFYLREMNLSQTADILGVPEGTAKAWLHRGREMLKRKLGGSLEAPAVPKEVQS